MLLGFGLHAVAAAATLQVGPTRTYTQIQDAIDAAVDGDLIQIDAGMYNEALDVAVNVHLLGAGSLTTIVDADVGQDVVNVSRGADVVVTGLALRGGRRGVRVDSATLALDAVEVGPNTGANDGGGLSATDAVVVVDGSRFVGNAATGRGGALYATQSSVTLRDSRFEGNAAPRGGGLFVSGGALAMERCDVVGNAATLDGGGVVVQADASATLVDDVLVNNSARAGGGLYASGSGTRVALTDTGVASNTSLADAAGVLVDAGAAVTSTRGAYAQHEATGLGAGVVVSDDARWDGVGDLFAGNDVGTGLGGALYVDGQAAVSLAGATFALNGAGRGGAVYAATDGSLVFDAVVFDHNTADERGGAIAFVPSGAGALAVSRARFVNNSVTSPGADGGALWASGGSVALRRNVFNGNRAPANGGAAAFVSAAILDVSGDSWCGNTAARGGALHASASGSVAFRNEVFADDRATGQGGAVYFDGGPDVLLASATFVANQASEGGAVYLKDTGAHLREVLVAFTAGGDGVAGASASPENYTFTADAFFDNALANLGGALSSVSLPGSTVTGDPGLARFSNDGNCDNDALWLDVGSPLIDAGDAARKDPDGSRADIGAYGGPDADPAWFRDVDNDGHIAMVDCDDLDPTIAATSPWYFDGDGDGYGGPTSIGACAPPPGYFAANDDCDDGDVVIHPNAVEDCTSSVDQNCDGSAGSADGDGDDAIACTDCDDADDTRFPGADELCDGVDQDCDGVVDNGAVSGTSTYFRDADGDGYGDDAASFDACALPGGYATRGGDCADEDASQHPGAVEACTDAIDRNCDGHAGSVDFDGDGYPGCEDCDDADDAVFPGAADVCNGADDDCDGAVDEAIELVEPVFPDVDGDGFGDASAPLYSCDPPAGFLADGSDCDDADAAIHPGVEDVPGGAFDENCDGLEPEVVDIAVEPPGCGSCAHADGRFVGLWLFGLLLARRRRS